MEEQLFSKKHFLKALKKEGLPATYMTLRKWEQKGIIDLPKNMQKINVYEWRFYTQEEIKENIEKIKKYKGL